MDRFHKMRIATRYRLLGAASANPEFKVALAAFDFAEEHTTGFRKDGVTPNAMHFIEVVAYTFTILPSLRYPVQALAAAATHDLMEDADITQAELADRFGRPVGHTVMRLSKKGADIKIVSSGEHFDAMLDDVNAPVIKGADRANNQGTMVGVFTPAKQAEYVEETECYILPMLKLARRRYSDQESAFENLKLMLRNQIHLVRAIHQAQAQA